MFGLFKKNDNVRMIPTEDNKPEYELLKSRLQDLLANILKIIEHDAHQAVLGEILLNEEGRDYQGIFDYYGGKLTSDVLFAKMLCNTMNWDTKTIDNAVKRGKEKAIEEYNTGCDLRGMLGVDKDELRKKSN